MIPQCDTMLKESGIWDGFIISKEFKPVVEVQQAMVEDQSDNRRAQFKAASSRVTSSDAGR